MHVVLVPLGASDTMGGWFGCGEDGSLWWIVVGSSRTCRLQCPMGGGNSRVACIQKVGFFFLLLFATLGIRHTQTLYHQGTPHPSKVLHLIMSFYFAFVTYAMNMLKKISPTNGDKPVICLILVS